ncbi:hypothetical protein K438DRAFT_887188 [Mycena galopus ATCC 62051]|nr:hypothetical protein K438DRAFT_887188 [Mycena galopus ATCC 62051]
MPFFSQIELVFASETHSRNFAHQAMFARWRFESSRRLADSCSGSVQPYLAGLQSSEVDSYQHAPTRLGTNLHLCRCIDSVDVVDTCGLPHTICRGSCNLVREEWRFKSFRLHMWFFLDLPTYSFIRTPNFVIEAFAYDGTLAELLNLEGAGGSNPPAGVILRSLRVRLKPPHVQATGTEKLSQQPQDISFFPLTSPSPFWLPHRTNNNPSNE